MPRLFTTPSGWLPPLLLLLCWGLSLGALPMLDEELYLDLAGQLQGHVLSPYQWWRSEQPWGNDPAGNTYIFAHPPLHWMLLAVLRPLTGEGLGLRLAVSAIWAPLLGFGVGRLAERFLKRPNLGAALWLASPVVLSGLQLNLMVDLPVLALSVAAMAMWVDERPTLAGALLAGACLSKYPALVLWGVWIPMALKRPRFLLRAALPFTALFGTAEATLALSNGHLHLLYVLQSAGEIGRGPMAQRAVGTLVRLGLTVAPAALGAGVALAGAGVAGAPKSTGHGLRLGAGGLLALGLGVAAALSTLGLELDGGRALVAGLALWGGGLVAMLGLALSQERTRLLALWGALTVGSVVLTHNYVGGRYLLPATVPLALLLAQGVERYAWRLPWARAAVGLTVGLWAALGVAMVRAERQHAQAWAQLAEELVVASPEPGVFTGEWTFRYVMRRRGWTHVSPGPLPQGTLIAVPTHASPGMRPDGPVVAEREVQGGSLRLVDLEQGVGYHAETLGARPVGISQGPMARGVLIRVEP